MALFVLIIVGIVVAQTWYDWRKDKQNTVLPEWAKGAALGGVLAVSLAAMTSFASDVIQDPASQWQSAFDSALFWPGLALAALGISVIVVMVRKRRLSWAMLAGGAVLGALWLGMNLLS